MTETSFGSRDQREPKYWALKQHLLDLLDSMPAGSSIPTERALADDFQVSRTTVRQALADLTAEGRLHRVQGKGTFAAEPKMPQRLELSANEEDIRDRGKEPSSRVLEVDEITAEGELPAMLGLRKGTKVLRVHRLRLADDEPVALEIIHLPLARFRGIRKHVRESGSLYDSLRERYGVELDRAEEAIETSLAGPQEAELLGADVGTPVLLLSRQSFASDGKPVEYVRSVYRGDRYKFITTLTKPRGRKSRK